MNDELDLVWAQFRAGEEQAYLNLYRRHYLGLINYGLKLCGDRSLANECITKMLIQLWDGRDKLPEVQNVRSYLITCLKRTIFKHYKSESTRKSKESFALSLTADYQLSYADYFDQIQSNHVLKSKLVKAMEVLTERQKELLKLKFFDDLDYDEIALQCNITKRTAYNIVHDAIHVLRSTLKSENGDEYYDLLSIILTVCLFYLK